MPSGRKMLEAPGVLFVARIASRSEILPSLPLLATRSATEVTVPSTVSSVVSTTSAAATNWIALNSEVSPLARFVAVAVTFVPAATEVENEAKKLAWPSESVTTSTCPRYRLPSTTSPGFEKNSMR